MAFLKHANASLVKSGIDFDVWAGVKRLGGQDSTFTDRTAAKVVLQEFDPKQYLLSHVTIMASVDTEEANQPLGRHMVEGLEIDRRFGDYYITPKTSGFINNNQDAWERKLLLSSYKTFIGAQNYCFVPGTMIVLADGTQKAIEDVSVGDMVLTHKGRARKVTRTFVRSVDEEIVSLYLDRYKTPVKCTKEHPFRKLSVKAPASRAYRGSKVSSQQRYHQDAIRKALRDGSGPYGGKVLTSPGWAEAGTLAKHDFLLGPMPSEQVGGTVEAATLLGYYLAGSRETKKRDDFAWLDGTRIHRVSWVGVEQYAGTVYNFEVEEDNSYVLGQTGVAVHNCEHIQVPELSKGRIIDAAARDIGDSVYIDILVATDRKHKALVESITSGQLQTLSMGCTVAYTQCTKCGNVAEDETKLCSHIKYLKGNTFFDEAGVQRKVAELCGHRDDPNSVKFIEASWVANPAFKGAVVRNILGESESAETAHRLQVAFTAPAPVADSTLLQKAAYLRTADFGADQEFPGGSQGTPKEDKPKEDDNLSKAVDTVADTIRNKALEKVRGEVDKGSDKSPDENRNNTIIKEALQHPEWRRIAKVLLGQVGNPKIARKMLLGMALYRHGGWKAVQASGSFTGRDILGLVRLSEMSTRRASRAGDNRIYRTILAVGGVRSYPDEKTFLAACRREIGREITGSEKADLLAKGYLYSLGS